MRTLPSKTMAMTTKTTTTTATTTTTTTTTTTMTKTTSMSEAEGGFYILTGILALRAKKPMGIYEYRAVLLVGGSLHRVRTVYLAQ
ncbi:hypothetical protein NU195Hw_Modified_390t1 [Hortaea werneckii]